MSKRRIKRWWIQAQWAYRKGYREARYHEHPAEMVKGEANKLCYDAGRVDAENDIQKNPLNHNEILPLDLWAEVLAIRTYRIGNPKYTNDKG